MTADGLDAASIGVGSVEVLASIGVGGVRADTFGIMGGCMRASLVASTVLCTLDFSFSSVCAIP